VRATAAWALGEIEDPSAASALGAALKDANVDVRRKAAWALGELGLERAPPALIEALRDADRDVRRITVHALGEIEDPAAVAGLGAIARGTGDVELRREALHALAEIRDPAALEILIAAMKDEDPQIRRIAAEALGKNH
jgi:HEAT repeat protein